MKVTGKIVYGLTDKPANRYEFDCEEMGGRVDVVSYFKHKHGISVQYPDLPCIQLGNARTCIPMEFVYVMGGALHRRVVHDEHITCVQGFSLQGEHNLAVGKLRPEFQQEACSLTV